jgi:flagellar biosynthesis protein FlhF
MYVRKFESDTMDGALKAIKRELGPDAIILKTVTNKGLKGAFKKSKFEITAAISEKNYTRKAKVDHVLNDEQKDQLYDAPPSYISNMIDGYSKTGGEERVQVTNPGYGKAGLNRSVQTVNDIGKKIKSGLDDFLSSGVGEERSASEEVEVDHFEDRSAPERVDYFKEEIYSGPVGTHTEEIQGIESDSQARQKLDILEQKVLELSREVKRFEDKGPEGLYQLRTTLRSLNIDEPFIQDITKKATFELSREELQDSDLCFEFALREMLEVVNIALPLFSSMEASEVPVVTVILSEASCGQTSMLYKLASLKNDCVLIETDDSHNHQFSKQIFNLKVEKATNIAEIVSATRKATEEGQSVFIDYKNKISDTDETKKFIDGLKRSFGKVEVLICLSAIHSEIYNRKVTEKYGILANGLVIGQLDLCLNYGSLFNLAHNYHWLPFKFFGTGEVVPDDIEAATAERVLAGMFRIK